MRGPDYELDWDGIDVGYSVDTVAYGAGGFVDGHDTTVEITHLDGEPVDGPFTLITDLSDPWPAACESHVLADWIAEHELEEA